MIHATVSGVVFFCWLLFVVFQCCDGVGSAPTPGTVLKAYFGRFRNTAAIAIDRSDVIYTSDGDFSRLVVVDTEGSIVRYIPLPVSNSTHQLPSIEGGIAVDAADQLYVADPVHARVLFLSTDGRVLVTVPAGLPSGIAVDPSGERVYVVDSVANNIAVLSAKGVVLDTFTANFSRPGGIALNGTDQLWVSDTGNSRIVLLSAQNGTVLRTFNVSSNNLHGLTLRRNTVYVVSRYPDSNALIALSAENGTLLWSAGLFSFASGVVVNSNGTLFVANTAAAGTISVYSPDGSWKQAYGGDFPQPVKLAVDSAGNVYIQSSGGNRIAALSPDGVILGYISGHFKLPYCLAFDRFDNLFVFDIPSKSVLQLAPDGTLIRTFENVTGAEALAIDHADNLVVADYDERRVLIFAPNGTRLYTFDLGDSERPVGVTVGHLGLLYISTIADNYIDHHILVLSPQATLIRKFNISGSLFPLGLAQDKDNLFIPNGNGQPQVVVMTINGTVVHNITVSDLSSPYGIAINPAGELLLSDLAGGKVLVVAALKDDPSILSLPSRTIRTQILPIASD